jgi:hypothetical protein
MEDIKNTLIKFLKFRLASAGKALKQDEFGNTISVEADIFSAEDFDCALELSLRAFNMVPRVTYFKWSDVETIDQIGDLLVTYAAHILLTKQSLLERGREFQIKDNGVGFVPPSVSDLAINISNILWHNWDVQVRNLKESDEFYQDFIKEPE